MLDYLTGNLAGLIFCSLSFVFSCFCPTFCSVSSVDSSTFSSKNVPRLAFKFSIKEGISFLISWAGKETFSAVWLFSTLTDKEYFKETTHREIMTNIQTATETQRIWTRICFGWFWSFSRKSILYFHHYNFHFFIG